MTPAPLVETDRDSDLVLRVLRLRRITRANGARCQAAFAALVVLNDEVRRAGGSAYYLDAPLRDGHLGNVVAAFHAGRPGEAICHGATMRSEVPDTADAELGRKCETAIQLWRRRAIRYGALQQALERAVRELAYGKELDA